MKLIRRTPTSSATPPSARALAEQLAEQRAVIDVQRHDRCERRRLATEHRDALAQVDEATEMRRRARRERDRDSEEAAALAELYRRATRSGARARIRTDINRSAEMRALRVARVRTATLWAGVPVLLAFGAWSTAGVQAGVIRLLGLGHASAGWWAAWGVEPALLTIVALIIVGRAILRSSGGDTDWRATVAEWAALSTSIALNLAGGWAGTGTSLASVLAHSVGPAGAAGTAFLIGLFDSYVSTAQPWRDAPRLADLDLSAPAAPASEVDGWTRQQLDQTLTDTRPAVRTLRRQAHIAHHHALPAEPMVDLGGIRMAAQIPVTPAHSTGSHEAVTEVVHESTVESIRPAAAESPREPTTDSPRAASSTRAPAQRRVTERLAAPARGGDDRNLRRAYDRLTAQLGREPSGQELGDEAGVSKATANRWKTAQKKGQ